MSGDGRVTRFLAGLLLGAVLGAVAVLVWPSSADAQYKPPHVLASHGASVNRAYVISGNPTPEPVHTPLVPHLYDYRGEQHRLEELRQTAEYERQKAEHEAQVAADEAARKARERAVAAPAPRSPRRSVAGSVWDALAQCESGGNWAANTGNGYYGGLQFLPSTWRSVGGTGLPHEHSRAEQIHRAQILQQRSGWGQWPACSRKLGLR